MNEDVPGLGNMLRGEQLQLYRVESARYTLCG